MPFSWVGSVIFEDCVGPILFLASDAMSGYVTGQILPVNGGLYLP